MDSGRQTSEESNRGWRALLAFALVATTFFVAGFVHQVVRSEREWQLVRERLGEPDLYKDLTSVADRENTRGQSQSDTTVPLELVFPVNSQPEPANAPAEEGEPLAAQSEPSKHELAERRSRMRKAAFAKRQHVKDRAYEEYLTTFPPCEPFVDGAMVNDGCELRPLPREEWKQRERVATPSDHNADDPLTGLDL